ncbi:MAG TPA: YhjD/YihY/BrkB family envelope integrity protein [Microlunatus sp.]|nr:YhjD/YihY/BrkB family envelope integrity protein [Microlunatus sp.]
MAPQAELREFGDDQCTDLAAALSYYAVLALFPALLALVSLLGIFGQAGKTDELIDVLSQMGAGSIVDTIKGPLEQLTASSSTGLALVIGVAGALWPASGYRAMNLHVGLVSLVGASGLSASSGAGTGPWASAPEPAGTLLRPPPAGPC